MPGYSFLHTADLHFGAGFTGRLELSPEKKEQLSQKIKQGFINLIKTAEEQNVSAVLICGDLFDKETINYDTINFFYRKLGESRIPFFLLPGNHDSYSQDSYYNPDWLIRRGINWPQNLKIFTSPQWECLALNPDVNIYGYRFTEQNASSRVLEEKCSPQEGKINLALFHGSCLDFVSPDKTTSSRLIFPFSQKELYQQSFTYLALGHYHNFREFRNEKGILKAAYPGSPWGWNLNETGEKVTLLLELDETAKIKSRISLVDYRIWDEALELTGLGDSAELEEQIQALLQKLEVKPEDIFHLRLTGRINNHLELNELEKIEGKLNRDLFHFQLDFSGLTPDYPIEVLLNSHIPTLENQFAKKLCKMESQAPPKEKWLYTQALYYGLDALNQQIKEIKPRWS